MWRRGREGGCADHDRRIDCIVGQDDTECLLVHLGGRGGDQVDRIGDRGVRVDHRDAAPPASPRTAQVPRVPPRRRRRWRGFLVRPSCRRSQRGAPRERLRAQHQRRVEKLVESVDPNDAGLPEQRVDRDVGLAIAAVCEEAARTPAAERPLLTATIGLRRDTRRAMRANLRGLPKDSRYKSTTSVPASSSQYWSRSLPLTSALLPTDTKLRHARVRCGRNAPGGRCRARPTGTAWRCGPGVDAYGEKVASRPMAVLTTPRQFGPTSRMPLRRATSRSSACAPTSPTSPNPALSTTTPATPFAAHWRTTSITAGGRDGNDRQVDGARDVEHGRIRLDAGDLFGAGIDRIHRPGEPTGQAGCAGPGARRCPGCGWRRSPRPTSE